jgi:hypothetical protein
MFIQGILTPIPQELLHGCVASFTGEREFTHDAHRQFRFKIDLEIGFKVKVVGLSRSRWKSRSKYLHAVEDEAEGIKVMNCARAGGGYATFMQGSSA